MPVYRHIRAADERLRCSASQHPRSTGACSVLTVASTTCEWRCVVPPATRTRVTRRIAADPTSTALLLAGPTALELWPGVRRVAVVGGRTVVETELPAQRLAASSVRALPPRRTPTAYVTRFEWAGPGLPETTGELTLAYAPAAG